MSAAVSGFIVTFQLAGLAMVVSAYLGFSMPSLHNQEEARPLQPAAPVVEGQINALV